jgi:hypothetical protein
MHRSKETISKVNMIKQLATPKKNSVDPELAAECIDLGMSPPAKEGYHHTLAKIMHEVENDGFTDEIDDRAKRKALIYLYGRDYFSGISFETRRRTEIAVILANPAILARLQTVLQNAHDTDVALVDETFYGNWKVKATTLWAFLDGAYTVFDEDVKEIVLRKQLSKNCFLHAPAVLHGYLVQHATKAFHGMIDLTKFVRHYFCDESFSRLVVHDGGGCSEQMLRNLVKVPFAKLPTGMPDFAKHTASSLQTYGPALVCGFVIDYSMASFRPTDERDCIPFFDNYSVMPVGEQRLHAMVLVGYRHNDAGDGYNFLLQNWWPKMQFLEVTEEFLIASCAEVVFALMPVLTLGHDHPVSMCRVAESHVLEGHDCRPLGKEGGLQLSIEKSSPRKEVQQTQPPSW